MYGVRQRRRSARRWLPAARVASSIAFANCQLFYRFTCLRCPHCRQHFRHNYLLLLPTGRPLLSRFGPELNFSPLSLVVVAADDLLVGSEALFSPTRLVVVLLTLSLGGGWADAFAIESTSKPAAISGRMIKIISAFLSCRQLNARSRILQCTITWNCFQLD